ncbi:MAG TPA: hypothetical protein ENJ95_19710 [Bacteroidetes bacterium]|nr:hypothetical protein [Bacteroidota bacterium]
MCTVTYIPQKENNFILTSNRDEAAARSPQNLTQIEQHGLQLIFPKDAGAGGTWIAASDDGRVACLLNGAFEKHKHMPPYRHSRGLMVLDSFRYSSAKLFIGKYNFEGLEPFTFIMVGHGGLYELIWDGKKPHARQLDISGKYIWSSSTLYPKDIRLKRKQWFSDWIKNRNDFSLEAIQYFHKYGGEADPLNGYVMNRHNVVQTVSITNVVKKEKEMEMIYDDLIRKSLKQKKLVLKPEQYR